MQTVILNNSRKQYVLLLGIGLLFVAGGLVIISDDAEAAWIGWMCVVFFGLCVAVFFRQISDHRPRLIIDDRGITDRMLSEGVIAWSDIEAAYLASMSGHAFICLELRNTDDYLQRLSSIKRKAEKANTALGFTPISLNLSGVQAKPEDVLDLILMRIEVEQTK